VILVSFGKIIKEIRLEKGLSQKQLAGEDMTREYISLIENGHAIPSEEILRIISKRLDKPIEFFLGEKGIEDDNIDVYDAILDKAKEHFFIGNYQKAIDMATHVLKMIHHNAIIAEAYLIIISSYNQLTNYELALENSQISKEIVIQSKNNQRIVKYFLERGMAAFNLELFNLALSSYEQAVNYSGQLKILQYDRIRALMFLGTTNIRLGDFPSALEYYLKAEKEARVSGDDKLYGEVAMGLGKVYFQSNFELNKSIQWTKKSVELLKRNDNNQYVMALHNLAVIILKTGRKEEALRILHECARFYEVHDLPHKKASVYEEFIKINLYDQKLEIAEKDCKVAINLLEKKDDGVLRAKLYRLIGVVKNHKEDWDNSFYFLRMSYDLLKRIGSSNEANLSKRLIKESQNKIRIDVDRLNNHKN